MEGIISVKVSLRLAEVDDLKINRNTLRYGQCYAVKNSDGLTLSGMHIINEDTDPLELKFFLDQKRLLVPVSCLDATIKILD
ncbi:hypothetical protein I215_01808 [Galbibacter marinus]|uniref:Uncharacterized protein n=1 Tax=Galbibacter marinus TaxID=555500 RepID=K2P5G0_9FLAO|nr:hypothetical protein [Galbibacter marinus]EKF56218.1 hypothetical protein I215_01808 [Galbibacter marinus]